MAMIRTATSDPLVNLVFVMNSLDDCGKVGVVSQEHLSYTWLLATKMLGSFLSEVRNKLIYHFLVIIIIG